MHSYQHHLNPEKPEKPKHAFDHFRRWRALKSLHLLRKENQILFDRCVSKFPAALAGFNAAEVQADVEPLPLSESCSSTSTTFPSNHRRYTSISRYRQLTITYLFIETTNTLLSDYFKTLDMPSRNCLPVIITACRLYQTIHYILNTHHILQY